MACVSEEQEMGEGEEEEEERLVPALLRISSGPLPLWLSHSARFLANLAPSHCPGCC